MRFLVVVLLAWLVAALSLPGEAAAHGAMGHEPVVAAQTGTAQGAPVDACCHHLVGCASATLSMPWGAACPCTLSPARHDLPPALAAEGMTPRPDLPPPRV